MGSLLSFFYLSIGRSSLAVTRYRVSVPRLPPAFEGFTILHLTDLHSKSYGPRQSQLLELLSPLTFQMTAITGDSIVGGECNISPLLDLLRGVNHKPVYMVNGNHEWANDSCAEVERHVSASGGVVLNNRAVRLQRGNEHIWVVGVDDPITGHARLERAVRGTDGAPRILLAHAPTIAPEASEAGIDLVLAGHTHGGQVRLPLAGAVYVSRLGYFPHWSHGFYRVGGTGMVVNAGLGETSAPVRFNMDPEVVLVTLVSTGGDAPDSDRVADVMKPLKRKVKRFLQRNQEG